MENVQNNRLTIFTPTYNRAYSLPKLYESLCSQTNPDFAWMVIDDGSDDGTKDLIKEWIKEEKIDIEYFFQENSGKHIAYNTAIENCSTPWIMCVDSDDFLTNDAVETIRYLVEEVNNDTSVSGLVGQKGNLKAEKIFKNWPEVEYCRFYDIFDKYGFNGEIVLVNRLSTIKNLLFPQIEGERFIPENVLYRRMDTTGRFRLFDRIIYCFEYKNDGYTKNTLSLVVNNPKGYLMSLEYNIKGSSSLKVRAKAYAYHEAIRTLMHLKTSDIQTLTLDPKTKLLSVLYMPHYYLKIKRGIKMYL